MPKSETLEAEQESFALEAPAQQNPKPVTGELIAPDKVQAIIDLSEQVEKLGTALDKIRKFALQRALPGDWVRFGEEGEEGYLELVGPGADRIAAALGISFTNWSDTKESWSDKNGQAYRWWYRCSVHFGGRTIDCIEGRASTRDKFFGRAHGEWKELADVNESDIRTAARHNCMKEGVKVILGLRRIPESEAEALGLSKTKIRSVEFESSKKGSQVASDAPKTEDGGIIGKLLEAKKGKSSGEGKAAWTMYFAKLDNGTSATYFDSERDKHKLHKDVTALIGKKVVCYVKQDGKYLNLEHIKLAPEGQNASAGAPTASTHSQRPSAVKEAIDKASMSAEDDQEVKDHGLGEVE